MDYSKYEKLRRVGIGSYGVVFKCVNRLTGQTVAIKRYSESDTDPVIRKIAMREVRMLRQLKHPNLINLIEVFRRKKRLHLVFDYCELTVLDVIEKYRQECPCIHRDIKPENILLAQNGVVKLCDFGFARPLATKGTNNYNQNHNNNNNADNAFTDYVATRWYRAPELLIGDVHYDIKIDIWAIGCVAAELMRGEPLWPGKSDIDQLYMITGTLGGLTSKQKQILTSRCLYDNVSIEHLLERRNKSKDSIELKIPDTTSGLNFVSACLRIDSDQRPTTDELLLHNYIYSSRIKQFTRAGITSSSRKVDTNRRTTDAGRTLPSSSKRQALADINVNKALATQTKFKFSSPQHQQEVLSQSKTQQLKIELSPQKAGVGTKIPVTASHDSPMKRRSSRSTSSSRNNKIITTEPYNSSKYYRTREKELMNQNVQSSGLGSTKGSRIPKPILLPSI